MNTSSTHHDDEPQYEVVWPLGKSVSKQVAAAPGLADLNGKVVCEIWDWVFRGDQMYAVLNEELRKRYPDIRIIDHKTMGDSHGVNERDYVANLARRLKEVGGDAVISGVGA
jgi:hypothetical protein